MADIRRVHNPKVVGSNPTPATNTPFSSAFNRFEFSIGLLATHAYNYLIPFASSILKYNGPTFSETDSVSIPKESGMEAQME